MTLTGSLLKSTVVAALGGLLFGFDTAVIAGATAGLTTTFSLTPGTLGLTVSIALIGTVIGSLLAGIPGDRYGRRDSLRFMAVLYLLSAFGCAFAWDWYSLVFFRFIGGLGIGGSSVLGPMYIAEIAPAKWRGRLVGFFQLNVVGGILLAYFSNYLIGLAGFGPEEWRWMLGVTGIPALLFFVMLFTIPRSPRWLVQKSRLPEARAVLVEIGEENVETELQQIVTSIDAGHGHGSESLFQSKYRVPIFLAVSIAAFNQFSGINAILYYLNDIFAKAGFSKVSGDQQAVLIGVMNLAACMVAMTIIDRAGRKTLLLIGSVGCALSLSLHMDGARFANACASLGCAPADITWRAGVDVLCFGGTKNGMAAGEAVVFFNRAQAEDFDYRCKQAGQLASKMRFLSAPWVGMIENGAWLRHAGHANECARRFAGLIADIPGIERMFPVEANAVFLRISDARVAALRARGWIFYQFIGGGARFMFAWDAREDRIEELARDITMIAASTP